MRLATDTGGTFTDLIVEDDQGTLSMYKASTTPASPIDGVLDVLSIAARDRGWDLARFLGAASSFVHGTTHALNAVVTQRTARTALLVTEGHRDILLFREGGRKDPFDHARPYPEPYVPRWRTFEVAERIGYGGEVIVALDEDSVLRAIEAVRELEIEAVAVCLLWSVANPRHEERVASLLDRHLAGIPYSISSRLNPVLREYRRTIATAIDASLKPMMGRYIRHLDEGLRRAGFAGRLQILNSLGGLSDAEQAADAPIQLLKSGPSMAPVAGRFYAGRDVEGDLIVSDSGGTTYDVSVVVRSEIPRTRETWIGERFGSDLTGFPSIDVKSVGAGGGSVAWVDSGGVLHVGPQSQGADPGPACYGRGGTAATITDASVVLGYVDPDFFLGGRMRLDANAAGAAIDANVASKLGVGRHEAASAVLSVATENMVQAILGMTTDRGVDPTTSTLVGGGGAAGLNSIFIARRLGSPRLVFPEIGAALSTAGATVSDLTRQFNVSHAVSTRHLRVHDAMRMLSSLRADCLEFARRSGVAADRCEVSFSVEARYTNQVWELEVPLGGALEGERFDLWTFVEDFHQLHQRIFGVSDRQSAIEIQNWCATARCPVREGEPGRLRSEASESTTRSRRIYLPDEGLGEAPVLRFEAMPPETALQGPAIIESPFTSIVLDRRSRFRKTCNGSVVVDLL